MAPTGPWATLPTLSLGVGVHRRAFHANTHTAAPAMHTDTTLTVFHVQELLVSPSFSRTGREPSLKLDVRRLLDPGSITG